MAADVAVHPLHRINPISFVLIAFALVGALVLGFGLRTWTEPTVKTPAPIVVHEAATPPTYCRLAHPC